MSTRSVKIKEKCKPCGFYTFDPKELAEHNKYKCPFRTRLTSEERYDRMMRNKDNNDAKRAGASSSRAMNPPAPAASVAPPNHPPPAASVAPPNHPPHAASLSPPNPPPQAASLSPPPPPPPPPPQ